MRARWEVAMGCLLVVANSLPTSALSPPEPASAAVAAPTLDRVGFPKDYATSFRPVRAVLQKDEPRRGTVFANDLAASVTDPAALPYPIGATLVMEWRTSNGEVARLDVMKRGQGYGAAYGEQRTGEWEYASYRPDGAYATAPEQSVTCAACHMKAGAARDFVFRAQLGEELGAAPGDGAVPVTPSADTLAWFQATEQELMRALAPGDKGPWERITDPSWVLTGEQGEVLPRQQFLDELRGLPAGLAGDIVVEDLTVQEFPSFAIVRFLANEWETVFGQRLTTKYRVTDTFRRDGDSWKTLATHLSVVTTDPPRQEVSTAAWPGFVGRYRLEPDGWIFTVELRNDGLYGGRDPKALGSLLPLAPNVFVQAGSLGEWIFVADGSGRATRLVSFRKFGSLVWTRLGD